jgi:hypothetical protein
VQQFTLKLTLNTISRFHVRLPYLTRILSIWLSNTSSQAIAQNSIREIRLKKFNRTILSTNPIEAEISLPTTYPRIQLNLEPNRPLTEAVLEKD